MEPQGQLAGRVCNGVADGLEILRMNSIERCGCVGGDVARADSVNVTDAGAGIGKRGSAVGPKAILVQGAGNLADQFVEGLAGQLLIQHAGDPLGE